MAGGVRGPTNRRHALTDRARPTAASSPPAADMARGVSRTALINSEESGHARTAGELRTLRAAHARGSRRLGHHGRRPRARRTRVGSVASVRLWRVGSPLSRPGDASHRVTHPPLYVVTQRPATPGMQASGKVRPRVPRASRRGRRSECPSRRDCTLGEVGPKIADWARNGRNPSVIEPYRRDARAARPRATPLGKRDSSGCGLPPAFWLWSRRSRVRVPSLTLRKALQIDMIRPVRCRAGFRAWHQFGINSCAQRVAEYGQRTANRDREP
jgi:hypothetical protein